MKRVHLIFLFSLLFLITGHLTVFAQDNAPALPSGPVLKRAPDFASWKVICQTLSTTSPAPPLPPPDPGADASTAPSTAGLKASVTTIVKTRNIRRIDVDGADGHSLRWCYGDLQFLQRKDNGTAVLYSAPELRFPDNYLDFSRSDFPECAWVSAKNYIGVKQVGGHSCHIFTEKNSILTPGQQALVDTDPAAKAHADSFLVTSTAYIDVQTLLPVQVQVGNLSYTYQFLPPPTEILVLPPQLMAQVQTLDQYQKDALRRPAHF